MAIEKVTEEESHYHDLDKMSVKEILSGINAEDSIYRSKAVVEPPLMIAISVLHAIRDAIASTADYTASPRLDAPATAEQKAVLLKLSPKDVKVSELAGDPIRTMITNAPGNGAPIGGLKVITEHGWFAARPSGTEEVYKLYAESFRGNEHLRRIQEEAQALLSRAMTARPA